jgi:hypothetical protein
LTDWIGPLNATYGKWQNAQAVLLNGEMFWS